MDHLRREVLLLVFALHRPSKRRWIDKIQNFFFTHHNYLLLRYSRHFVVRLYSFFQSIHNKIFNRESKNESFADSRDRPRQKFFRSEVKSYFGTFATFWEDRLWEEQAFQSFFSTLLQLKSRTLSR